MNNINIMRYMHFGINTNISVKQFLLKHYYSDFNMEKVIKE